jgi:DNA repair protein RadC
MMRISEISLENRPRERLIKYGVNVLSNAELLAIILQKGTRKENVIDMSNKLISKFGLDSLSDLSLKELQDVDGVGPAKAMQIKAIFELSNRYKLSKTEKSALNNAEDVYRYASTRLKNDKEYFFVIHLDSKNHIIKDEIVSIGILNANIIHPREIFRTSIKECSNAIICVHNHPSGDVNPSDEDIQVTKILQKSSKILNIPLLDHVIISDSNFFSFKNEGLL